MTGKNYDIGLSFTTIAAYSNINPSYEDKIVELFNIRITSKWTKIDALFDSVSYANLISKYLVKSLGLEIWNHPRPYPLGWLNKSTQIKATKRCRLMFSITTIYIDEVELDVVPVDICGVALQIRYLYDHDAVF